jgi:hypothetical protein
MGKIRDALESALAATKCAHDFEYLKPIAGNGVVAVCRTCRCRFAAWPGGMHYDEIVAARDTQKARSR